MVEIMRWKLLLGCFAKMTTQFVDFLELENYDFVFNPLLIDVAN